MRWWKNSTPTVPAIDPRTALMLLSTIADRGCELEPQTRQFLRACSQPGDVPAEVAVVGHRLATEYNRLAAWVLDATDMVETRGVRDDLTTQLRYHCLLVHDAVRFAFPKVRTVKTEACRHGLALGAPAADLRETQARLAQRVAEMDPGT